MARAETRGGYAVVSRHAGESTCTNPACGHPCPPCPSCEIGPSLREAQRVRSALGLLRVQGQPPCRYKRQIVRKSNITGSLSTPQHSRSVGLSCSHRLRLDTAHAPAGVAVAMPTLGIGRSSCEADKSKRHHDSSAVIADSSLVLPRRGSLVLTSDKSASSCCPGS